MSFIQRELDRIGDALRANPDGKDYGRLYAAQQALAWATDPSNYASPMKHITGNAGEDCGTGDPVPPVTSEESEK